MISASTPTPPPPPPPPVRTDTHVVEPDEQWKADLRKRIEHDLLHMVSDAQIIRDTILGSQPPESSRERAQREYEKSLNNIRTLAQEEFNRQLRHEISERKWALEVVVSNMPDVARQQQWILDNIRKADEKRMPLPPTDALQNAEGVLSASPQQQSDSEQGPDESPEEGYRTGELEDEEGESEELGESADEEGEDGEEDGEEVDHRPRQSRPPSYPSVPMIQPLHSKSSVSPRNGPSHQRQRQPPDPQPAEHNDDDDTDDTHQHSAYRHESQGSQPYSPGGGPRRQSSGSQYAVWRPFPRAPEPSGISRGNGHVFNTGPVQFPRRGSVNSTGSISSSEGLHRAGSINSDHRSSGVALHGGSERHSTQSRDRIASNISIGPHERQTSASANPHDRPSPPTFPTAPRAIPSARPLLDEAVRFPMSASAGSRAIYAMQRSPEDMRQGMPIPRGPPTPEEGPRGVSWGSSLNSCRPLGDFSVHRRNNSRGEQRLPPIGGDLSDTSDDVVGQLDDRQSVRSMRSVRSVMSIEQMTAWWETEARRKEEEANRKEEDASRKEEEARRLEEKARQSLDEARRLEAGARQADASAKVREAAAQSKEAEAKHKEAEAKKREAAAQKLEAEAQRKEGVARHRELEAQRKEEQARLKEDEARRRKEEAKRLQEGYERKKREIERREAELKEREAELLRKENAARLAQEEEFSRQAIESPRLEPGGPSREDEDTSRLEAEEAAWAHVRNRAAKEAESTAREQEKQPKANGRKGSKAQAKRQKEKALEEQRRQRELEEEEQRLEQQQHHDEIHRQRAREEQQREFQRREAQYYQRTLERERQNSMGASFESPMPHRPGSMTVSAGDRSSASSTFSSSAGSAIFPEEQRLRVLEEQRRRADEKNRQRDDLCHRQQQHYDEIHRQRAREEQQREFQRREELYYQRTLERERHNSMGASFESPMLHRPGFTTGSAGDRSSASSTFSSSTGSATIEGMGGMRIRMLPTQPSIAQVSTPPSLPIPVRSKGEATPLSPWHDIVPQAPRQPAAYYHEPEQEYEQSSSSDDGVQVEAEECEFEEIGHGDLEAGCTPPPALTSGVLQQPVGQRPRTPVAVPSQMTSDDLRALWGRVGVYVGKAASQLLQRSKHTLVGNGSYEGFVAETLAQVPNALPPQSPCEYGILIYAQVGVQVHTHMTDILPGDVIVLSAAKLKGYKGFHFYMDYVGEGTPCTGVVSEFDTKKLVLKALWANKRVGRATVESVSYRLGDLKSGTIKVYRVREA